MLRPAGFAIFCALALLDPSARSADAPPPSPRPDDGWVQVGVQEGITVSRKRVPGDPMFAYKGEGVLNAPIGKLIAVSRDTARQPEWVNRMVAARILREITPFDRIIYIKIHSPWPVKDRDFVLESKLVVDRARKTAVFDVHSVQDPLGPADACCVRAEMRSNHIEMKAVDAERTSISAEAHVDPKGALPAWLVNLVQKTAPHKTIQGLLRQVAKKDVADFFEATPP
jgi:hypothetical protein